MRTHRRESDSHRDKEPAHLFDERTDPVIPLDEGQYQSEGDEYLDLERIFKDVAR